MILCFLHQPALRRHLDDGVPLSARAHSHVAACRNCRELLAEHRQIIAALERRRERSRETPDFLHGRVMARVRGSRSMVTARGFSLRWAAPMAALAALVLVGSLWISQRPVEPKTVSWPEIKTAFALEAAIPRNPLETEIENLKADTLNATKALATSFNMKDEAGK